MIKTRTVTSVQYAKLPANFSDSWRAGTWEVRYTHWPNLTLGNKIFLRQQREAINTLCSTHTTTVFGVGMGELFYHSHGHIKGIDITDDIHAVCEKNCALFGTTYEQTKLCDDALFNTDRIIIDAGSHTTDIVDIVIDRNITAPVYALIKDTAQSEYIEKRYPTTLFLEQGTNAMNWTHNEIWLKRKGNIYCIDSSLVLRPTPGKHSHK